MSLIATAEANGKNPAEYLADVLIRIQSHPTSGIDELLPQNSLLPDVPAKVPIAQAPTAT